jgi:acetyl-CoA hydrolase
MPLRLDPASIDLARFVRPGDLVLVGQGCGEPLTLSEALVAQRHALGGVRVLLFTVMSETFRPEHTDALRFVATAVTAGTRTLAAAGGIDPIPVHYGDLEQVIAEGTIAPDVVLVQVGPAGPDGRHGLSAAHDAAVAAIPRARTVIAELNRRAPRIRADVTFAPEDFDAIVETDRPMVQLRWPTPGDVERRIGEHVAALVPERATLQLGIGAIPEAVLARLVDRRGLGFHSGMMSDAVVELIGRGAIDDAHKGIDEGIAITGLLLGTDRLFRFVDDNPRVGVRRPQYTHGARVHARVKRLFSINSALEVDLSGQVNAEAHGGRYIGTVGGQVEFVRGTRLSEGGRSAIALPSTVGKDRRSRIVARLDGPVTTARSDVDCIVTEWGVAELRGRSLAERARALIAISDPAHRETLERAAFGQVGRGAGG